MNENKKSKFLSQSEYINNVRSVHGNRYSFEKTIYKELTGNVIVTCVKHDFDFIVMARALVKKKNGKTPIVGSCPICVKEYFESKKLNKPKVLRTPRVLKLPKIRKNKVLLFIYRDGKKYYPCIMHGEVPVGVWRKFNLGCPICNLDNYKISLVNGTQHIPVNKTKKNKNKPHRKILIYVSYEEAKKRVNNLNIISDKEYRLWRKRTCQNDMPYSPSDVYKNKGWVDYYEFFGTNRLGKMSAGEKKIFDYLKRKNIEFDWQKKFDDCKNIKHLVFDFYLPNYNTLIEFDGEQHFRMSNFSSSIEVNKKKFEQVQKNDKIKTNYCKSKGIKLLRMDNYHLVNNIIEWELDGELSKIAAEIAMANP